MPEKKAWFLYPGCVVIIILLSLIDYGLYWFFDQVILLRWRET